MQIITEAQAEENTERKNGGRGGEKEEERQSRKESGNFPVLCFVEDPVVAISSVPIH